jgi:hypothetical protein
MIAAQIVTRFHLALSPAKVNTPTAVIIFNERSHEIQGNGYISSSKRPTPYFEGHNVVTMSNKQTSSALTSFLHMFSSPYVWQASMQIRPSLLISSSETTVGKGKTLHIDDYRENPRV